MSTVDNINSDIAQKLELLQSTKADIQSAIAEKGQVISDATPFSAYSDKIREISAMPPNTYTIDVQAGEGGTVSGGGIASNDMTVTVHATPSSEYDFRAWKENEQNISYDEDYTFQVSEDRSLNADFYIPVIGRDWKKIKLPGSYNIVDAAYGNGIFVAIQMYSDICIVSNDGINWREVKLSKKIWASGICYGNDKFVVIGESYDYAYSEDGLNWTFSTLGNASQFSYVWNSIAYGNGKFVIVSRKSTDTNSIYAYSTNGINWTIGSAFPDTTVSYDNICYGGGKFVIIPSGSSKALYSTTGTSWSTSNLPYSDYWGNIVYGLDKFVVVASGSYGRIAYSSSGTSWSSIDIPFFDGGINDIAYGSGKYVIAPGGSSNDATEIAYSDDGINWIETFNPMEQFARVLVYGNGMFVGFRTNVDEAIYSISK